MSQAHLGCFSGTVTPNVNMLDMLLDIDEYERFCETHPGYKNNRAVMAIANIKRVYQDHEENGGFLV